MNNVCTSLYTLSKLLKSIVYTIQANVSKIRRNNCIFIEVLADLYNKCVDELAKIYSGQNQCHVLQECGISNVEYINIYIYI